MVTFSPKMLTHVSTVPVNEDSLLKIYSDSAYKIYEIKIKGTLNIVYKKNTKLKNDIHPGFGQPASGTITGLRLRQAPMLVDYKGQVLTPANVYYDGMWEYERFANMLPENYVAGK
jgi:hypothetical protein